MLKEDKIYQLSFQEDIFGAYWVYFFNMHLRRSKTLKIEKVFWWYKSNNVFIVSLTIKLTLC